MVNSIPQTAFTHLVVGQETKAVLLNGKQSRYINLDNAASTPSFKSVQKAVNNFLDFYSSVHRGSGFKSQLSTHFYEHSRSIVLEFLNASPETHVCIFVRNTTEALNKLSLRFPIDNKKPYVVTSGMEHHSNDLPWRSVSKVIHVGLTPDGQIDLENFQSILGRLKNKISLVAITGASNVTGFLNPIHSLAEMVHASGAQIVVDCAQLAAHRKIDMRSLDDPSHLDFVAISAHKMYAPFGTGALVGRKDIFEQGDPDQVGGGTVEIVTLDSVEWASPPERDEAGSPNVVGAIALAAAIKQLQTIGIETIAEHESELTSYTLRRLAEIPSIRIFGDPNPEKTKNRLGVIPFTMNEISHFLVAAVLGSEFGIGVRSGCFCAHPYLLHLLEISPQEAQQVRNNIMSGDRTDMPGMVRASLGLYNTEEDIDALIEALQIIDRRDFKGKYVQDNASGEFTPRDWHLDFNSFFSLD